MSKGKSAEPTPPPAPTPTNSEYWSDGNLLGKTTMSGGVTKQESFMTPFEKQQQQLQQQYLPTVQQRMLNPDQSQKDSWLTMATATKDNQMKAFNQDFDKAQNDMIQNLSSRGAFGGRSAGSSQVNYFGNELAKTGADQLSRINNDFTANLQNYELNDFNKNQNLYNMLNGGLGQQMQANQNNINTAMNGFNTGNNFNQQGYQNNMNQWALNRALNPVGQRSGISNTIGYLNPAWALATGNKDALGAQMQLASLAMSDIKTKQNIKFLENKNGINWYEFEYKPEYNQPKGRHIGVIAQEVEHIKDAVIEINGIKHVDYSKIA